MSENIPTSTMNVTTADTIIANDATRKLVPGFGGRIAASLVWDGTDEVRVPEAMGKPRPDQMQGTSRERLSEVSLRICYDSVGTGRDSEKCHEHILQVKHWSVHEHATFTVECEFESFEDAVKHAAYCLNRPSLWADRVLRDRGEFLRITMNLRHVMEWIRHVRGPGLIPAGRLGKRILEQVEHLAPRIFKGSDIWAWSPKAEGENISREMEVKSYGLKSVKVVEPETDEEKWVTLYMTGSRGWSHELVRHGDWTAISQRSTRYVDECESEWVMHPLLGEYVSSIMPKDDSIAADVDVLGAHLFWLVDKSRTYYKLLVERLQPWLEAKGIDKFSARKQARGAARGLLGNALETEVIFSASVAQWRHMLNMRAADAADAEIRLGFAEAVLPCLKASRYADRFQDFVLAPAKDGIGRSLSGGGHK